MNKIPIQFHKTMNANKRASISCYFRKNVLETDDRGLYPAVTPIEMTGSKYNVQKTNNRQSKIMAGNNILFYKSNLTEGYRYIDNNDGTVSLNGSADFAVSGVGSIPIDSADSPDGSLWIASGGKVYDITGTLQFDTGGTGKKIIYDGVYFYAFGNKQIHRFLYGGTASVAFNDTYSDVSGVGLTSTEQLCFVTEFGTAQEGFSVLIWDKTSTTLLDKKIVYRAEKFLEMFNIGENLFLITHKKDGANYKENRGKISVKIYNGGVFQEVNSIVAGSKLVERKASIEAGEVAYLSLSQDVYAGDYKKDTFMQNAVYKITNSGGITIESDVVDMPITNSSITMLGRHNGIMFFGGAFYEIATKVDGGEKLSEYANYNSTAYATNFTGDFSAKKKLLGIGLAFEKIFKTGASVKISYRVSDRDDWTLLKEITSEDVKNDMESRISQTQKDLDLSDITKGLSVQVYELIKNSNGSAFAEYYECQFKFELFGGMSIIDAWFYSDAIKRNTRN